MDIRKPLNQFLTSIFPLPVQVLEEFTSVWEEVEFPRKVIITREGQTEKYLYYVLQGVQRGYYLKNGKEITTAFTYPPSFSGIPESFLTQSRSMYNLEAITPSRFLRITHLNLEKFCSEYREVDHLFRVAVQNVLVGIMKRNFELQAYSMEEKFTVFVKRSGHLLNVVPHKHLASYLGIDPTNFSKLLNRLRVN